MTYRSSPTAPPVGHTFAPAGSEDIGGSDSWAALRRELDLWAETDRQATFWWRDDDAGEATMALDRLLALARRYHVPVALAVIPARASVGLADRLATAPDVAVLQHGWSHANWAPEGRQNEFGDDRPGRATAADLLGGWARLRALFAEPLDPGQPGRVLPVLVPPWNRIGAATAAALPALGYRALSGLGPRDPAAQDSGLAAGLRHINVHMDIIDWQGSRGFAGNAAVLGAALDHLAARRAGRADPDAPTGLMTHHLDHDEACWRFLDRFLAETTGHPAARWVGTAELLAPSFWQ